MLPVNNSSQLTIKNQNNKKYTRTVIKVLECQCSKVFIVYFEDFFVLRLDSTDKFNPKAQ